MATPTADSYIAATGITLVQGGRGTAPLLPLPFTEVVAAPQFWTQFSRPQVVRDGGSVYLGTTDMDGDSVIHRYDEAAGTTQSFTLSTGTGPNGHDSAVIGVRADGRLIAVWAVQNADCFRRISTNPGDVTAWGPPLELSGSTDVSYCNLFKLSTPGLWYVHSRQGTGGGGGDRVCVAWASSNDGDTFGTGQVWLTQAGERPYVISCNNGVNRVDFFCTNKHQTDVGPDSFFNLYHCYALFAADGAKQFFTSAGSLIGSSVTRVSDQCTLVHDGAAGGPAWNWDIKYGSDGHPRVLYVRQQASDDHRHMYARWTGSAWSATEIGAAGQRLYSSEIWSDAALCFDATSTEIVIRGVWVGSAVEGQDWRSADNGATWSKYADITTGSAAGVKFYSPVTVKGGDTIISRAAKRGPITNWSAFSSAVYIMGKG